MKKYNIISNKFKINKHFLLFIFLISILIFCLLIPLLKNKNSNNFQTPSTLKNSSNFNTFEGVQITELYRNVELSGNGLLTAEDTFTIKNIHNNPISFITMGIDKSFIENLIYYDAKGPYSESLDVQFSETMIETFKMVYIYFDCPLLPSQEISITFTHSYKDLYNFSVMSVGQEQMQTIVFNFYIYPIVPYEVDYVGIFFFHPELGEEVLTINDSGEEGKFEGGFLQYSKEFMRPFYYKLIIGTFDYSENTKLQIDKILRKITFNSLGYLIVDETLTIHNTGAIPISEFSVKIPTVVSEVEVFDYLGPIEGTSLDSEPNLDGTTKDLTILLTQNRVTLYVDSKFDFSIRYQLPYDEYHVFNWLYNSISIDLLLTKCDYVIYDQEIQIIIDGCENIMSITEQPNSIKTLGDDLVLIFNDDIISPLDEKHINIIYTLDFLEILMRPLIFTILFMILFTSFVIITKIRKEELPIDAYRKRDIPIKELREFYSLYEEKNAIYLDIQQADDDVKRKKLTRKKYLNVLKKYELRLKSLENELAPLRKKLEESTKIFENIFKKLELFEAERLSLKDNINLLENRYKRGRLPSKNAFEKLMGDFLKRREKVRKAIDRQINELKAYLY